MAGVEGHAFICYVRENGAQANHVGELFTAANIHTWRDTQNLWPGEDWRDRIRSAITTGAFAFIPIFTTESVARGVSGQYEELYLAADEMRRRPPNEPWIIPVRFDDCALPRINLGGGRLLDDIQRVDLFGPDAESNGARLVQAVERIVATRASAPVVSPPAPVVMTPTEEARATSEVKALLRDPTGDIRLFDILIPLADAIHDELNNEDRYPVDGSALTVPVGLEQAHRYWQDLDGLLDQLVTAAPWSLEAHAATWTEVVSRVARASAERRQGNVGRLDLRWLPVIQMIYASGLAALSRGNYAFIRAVSLDPTVRVENETITLAASIERVDSLRQLWAASSGACA